jgi:branched-chain amino acid transport system ATP-binding protein
MSRVGTAEGPALRLIGVHAGYGTTKVLHGVSVEVPKSSIVALLGANGAGKSTLLRVASGLLKPTLGRVDLMCQDVTRKGPDFRSANGLCHIPEGRSIFRSLSVRDNLELFVGTLAERVARIDRAITAFPALGSRLDQIAGTLSGGEQQMLALSRAYVTDPEVVLLDEVSLGLAPVVVDQIYKSLRELAREGVAMLLVEQYVDRALEMADLVNVLTRGEIATSHGKGQVSREGLMKAYLGESSADRAPVTAHRAEIDAGREG